MHAVFYRIDNFPPNKTHRMPKKYITRYSTSLSRKCKSKVQHIADHSCLNGFHQKARNKCDWGCIENWNLNALLVGIYIGATPMEYLLEISHEILQRTVHVATNPTSGYIFISEYKFKGNDIIISKGNL